MKKLLSLIMGAGFVLSLGLAYAEEGTGGGMYPSDRMINNDDLQRLILDKDRATINRMPEVPGYEGSAAGGVREEPEGTGTDIEQGKEPVDKGTAEPGTEGDGAGGESKTPERSRY